MKAGRDFFDRIEALIESGIEKALRGGLRGKKGPGARRNPFSYIEAFLKDPKVASIAPSTKFVIRRVIARMERSAKVVIEYGPAEGVITREILKRLPVDGILVAVELNEDFTASLSKLEDPRLKVIRGSVTEIDELVAPLSLPPADAIVSGIPFSFLKPVERHALLHKTADLLKPGGRFIAYQFTTHLVPLMKYHFDDVDIDFEPRNLPPHFIFTGTK